MNTPPNGGFPAILLATAAKLGYRVTIGARGSSPELGAFVNADTSADQPLLLAAGGIGRCTWALDGDPTCPPFVFSRETYLVLHEGTQGELLETVVWQGRTYRVQAQWDGFRPVAQAVVVR